MLFRAFIGTSDYHKVAIYEDSDKQKLLEHIMHENRVPGQEWVQSPDDNGAWLLFDPDLHETHEGAANDENTMVLCVTPVELGEWWEPDMS